MKGAGAWLGIGLALAAIALATLSPSSALPNASGPSISWAFGISDALRNVVLFFPLGAALAWTGAPLRRAIWVGVGISAGVELLQLLVPGRIASVSDVVTNAAGTAAGVLAVQHHRVWLQPVPAVRRVLWAGAGLCALAAAIAPALLFSPVASELRLFGFWSPMRLEKLYPYDGRVRHASVDGIELEAGPLEASERVRSRLVASHSLLVEAEAGHPPGGQAGLFAVYDLEQQQMLFVGPEVQDLLYLFRTPGFRLGLEPGRVRLPDALRRVEPGDTLRIRIEHAHPEICIEVNGDRTCRLGYTMAAGWRLLDPDYRSLVPLHAWIGVGWLALLCLPLGFWASGSVQWGGACLASIAALAFGPAAFGLLPTPTAQLFAPALGIGLGALLRRGIPYPPPA